MEEREQALAWVEGRSRYPHGEAVTLLETGDPDVFGFELGSRIGAEEMHALAERINALMDSRPGPLRILGKFTHFSMPAPGGLDAEYVRMKLTSLHKVERYAAVGGPLWLAAWVSAIAPLLRCEVRHFPADKEADAWNWLGASPASARPDATASSSGPSSSVSGVRNSWLTFEKNAVFARSTSVSASARRRSSR